MATPTPWQVAGGGKKICHSSYVTVKVFSRGTEPWPYYQPPVLVEPVGGTPTGTGGYGDINGGSGGSGPGDNSGGTGGGSGGTGGGSGGTGAGSAACPCGNTDGAGGAAPGP